VPVDLAPFVGMVPDQEPDATQFVAFVAAQVKVDVPPRVTELGLAFRFTTGGDAPETVTVALSFAVPALPVQVSVKVVDAFKAPVDRDPLMPTLPDHPPEAVQLDAFVDDQVRVEDPPVLMLAGLALNVTDGGGEDTVTVADWAAEPPAPVHVSVNFVDALSATVVAEPRVAFAPVQPPDAVHAVASVDDQVSVEVAPLFTVLGLAVSVTAGAGVVTDTVAVCEAFPPGPVQDRP
jgi:hypothetical protein